MHHRRPTQHCLEEIGCGVRQLESPRDLGRRSDITESSENLHRHRELRYLQAFWRYFCLLAEVIGLMVQLRIKVEVEVEKITGWMELLAAGIELGLWPSKCNTLTLMPVRAERRVLFNPTDQV